MSNDDIPEFNTTSGYPAPSAAEGAESAGNPPAQNDNTQHEPSPEHPRFNEVYRNWKDTEREAESLRERLAEYEMQQQFNPTPAPTPVQPQPQAPDDELGWFRDEVRAAVNESITPLQQRLEQTEAQSRSQQIIANFQTEHPEFDRGRDQEMLVATMKRYGTNNLEAGYRLAFPERVVGASQPQAPVADVPGVSAHVPTDSPEALLQRIQDPRTSVEERRALATRLSDMGGFGSSAAEKALGF